MPNSIPKPPTPVNEPVLGYLPGSKERADLEAELKRQSAEVLEIPCIINGEEVFTGDVVEQVMPHNHGHVIAVTCGGKVNAAIEAALGTHEMWSTMEWQARAAIFLKASELLKVHAVLKSTPPPCSTSRKPVIRPRLTRLAN